MKYVSVITDYTYLLWQQEIQAFNFRKLGILDDLVVVVLHDPGIPLSDHARQLGTLVQTHYFENDQPRRHYTPSNKPWGLMKLLEQHPEYGHRLFLLDSDVIFRETLDFTKLEGPTWYVSDSGAVGYLGYNYLKAMLGHEQVEEMANLVGLTAERLQLEQPNSGGAQYYMKDVTSEFCRTVAHDSIKLYDWAIQQKRESGTYKIQVWTAEMWSWLWNAFKTVPVRTHPEMNFAWAAHTLSDWETQKMLHLAGVVGTEKGCFFKGKYTQQIPWEVESNFDFVDRSRCWGPYVELIEEYRLWKPSTSSSQPLPPLQSSSLPSVLSPGSSRRAIAAYVDDKPALILQTKGLIESLKYIQAFDTDLVLFGPETALKHIPDHSQVVKVLQEPHPLAPVYGFINSIACLNGRSSDILTRYDEVLKSDVDVFLTPAWNDFRPKKFTCGQGFYANSEEVRDRIKQVADHFARNHYGRHNLGSTFYGKTMDVRLVCAMATVLCEWFIEVEFKNQPGAWPGWYRGVASMYATEIALNHWVPDLDGPSPLLDGHSTSTASVMTAPHVHCWHTDERFSKFAWTRGEYQTLNEADLDLSVIRDYCTAMALRSMKQGVTDVR